MKKGAPVQRIIGIDPGLTHTGWGIIEKSGSSLSFVGCGVVAVKAKASDNLAGRLLQLHEGVQAVLREYTPTHAAIEETFATPNGASTLKLGQARGALLLTLAQHGLLAEEYAAKVVKKALTGTGNAEKQQVLHMVGMLLPAARAALEGARHDAADALAIAITHANSVR